MPEVRDARGQVQSWDWLQAKMGPLSVERAVPEKPGQPVFRLEQIQVVEGPAILLVRVFDMQRLPLDGVLVARSWVGAPDLPEWLAPASRWRNCGVFGPSGQQGEVGFGLAPQDHYQLPNAGPASVWVADQAGPSDRIDGLGILDSGRLHVDLGFRVVQDLAPTLPGAALELSVTQTTPSLVGPPPPPEPPPVPLPLAGDQWALLIERLDQVIQALEEHAGE